LKFSAKKVDFLVSSGKKTISPLLASLMEKFWKNPLVAPPGKKPSDAHVRTQKCPLLQYAATEESQSPA